MGIDIHYHNCPQTEFDQLGDRYTHGRYVYAKGSNWFTVNVNPPLVGDPDVKLTWFLVVDSKVEEE